MAATRPDDSIDLRERNRALATRWMQQAWNERRDDVVDELMHPESIGHMEGGMIRGPEGFKGARAMFLSALPDLRIEVEDTLADDDAVALRWRVTGTHLGEGLGIAPSGRAVEIHGITWMRIERGRFVEGWDRWDFGGLLERLRP